MRLVFLNEANPLPPQFMGSDCTGTGQNLPVIASGLGALFMRWKFSLLLSAPDFGGLNFGVF